jgi:hypothetical protein
MQEFLVHKADNVQLSHGSVTRTVGVQPIMTLPTFEEPPEFAYVTECVDMLAALELECYTLILRYQIS